METSRSKQRFVVDAAGPVAGSGWLGTARPSASAETVAAVIAALQQFRHDTASVIEPPAETHLSPWKRAALAEGVSRPPELGEFCPLRALQSPTRRATDSAAVPKYL